MSNPVHPKVLGGFAGTVGGGAVGAAVYGVLDRIPAFVHLDGTTQQYIAGGLIAGLAAVGQFVVGYLSKWEPAVGKVAADIDADLFAEAPKADDSPVVGEAPKADDSVPPAV